MKKILEFDLDKAEEAQAYLNCKRSENMAKAITEFANNRVKMAAEIHVKDMDNVSALDIVYKEFNRILDENNIRTLITKL